MWWSCCNLQYHFNLHHLDHQRTQQHSVTRALNAWACVPTSCGFNHVVSRIVNYNILWSSQFWSSTNSKTLIFVNVNLRIAIIQYLWNCDLLPSLSPMEVFSVNIVIIWLPWMPGQSQKNPVGVSALPTGKFLRVWKVFVDHLWNWPHNHHQYNELSKFTAGVIILILIITLLIIIIQSIIITITKATMTWFVVFQCATSSLLAELSNGNGNGDNGDNDGNGGNDYLICGVPMSNKLTACRVEHALNYHYH